MKEKWKRIYLDGKKSNYKISSYGRIFNTKHNSFIHPYKHRKKRKTKEDLYYLYCRLYKGSKKDKADFKVHRLVAEYFLDNPHNYPCVNHLDGNPMNNHVENLEWCTNSHNVQHSFNNQLQIPIFGENHYKHKLSSNDVIEILHELDQGVSQSELARRYNVSKNNIHDIKNGKSWKCIDRKTKKLKENYKGEGLFKVRVI